MHDLVPLMDVGATVLEAVGLPVPAYMEGRSLRGYLEGDDPSSREFVFCEYNYLVMRCCRCD